MTIVLKLPIDTGNNLLPRAHEIDQDGLLMAFRFDEGGIPVDLSGNGATLTTVNGTPTYSSSGAFLSAAASFITNVYETPSITFMAIGRPKQDVETTAVRNMVGNQVTNSRGSGIYMSDTTGSNSYRGFGQTTQHKNDDNTNPVLVRQVGFGNYATRANRRFLAAVIDNDANQMRTFVPNVQTSPYVDNPTSPNTIAGRTLTQDSGGLIKIGNGSGAIELNEVLVYGKVKTNDEVLAQYARSREYWKNIHGFDIGAA